jgi:hypothetical protein
MASTYSTNPFFILSSTQSSGGDGLPTVSYSTTNGPLYPQLENDDDPATPSDYVQFDQETTTPRPNASSIYGSYSSDIIEIEIEKDSENEPVIHADPVISSSASFSSGDGRWFILFTTCTLFHFILFFLFNNPHTFYISDSTTNIH